MGIGPRPAAAQVDASAGDAPRWELLDERPGDGEQCIVCRKPIYGEDVVEIRFQGRTFFVGAPFFEDFKKDPLRYFATLQARAALWDETALDGPRLATAWLWFDVYVLTGLIFSALCGYVAVARALRPIPWFFAGLFGNVVVLGVLLAVPRGDAAALPAGIPRGLRKIPTTRAPVPCPSCGALNHPCAAACSGCGHELSPSVAAETGRV